METGPEKHAIDTFNIQPSFLPTDKLFWLIHVLIHNTAWKGLNLGPETGE